ncbi:competence protein CoiA [Loigolactobacillus binensis]|uniref:Competence protein CoiA n=1 Tax=Loigolactobacillus binensis TaxID=2559922 RepID=A0ABW3EGU6_9LACO|nr:competence protein CoiA family protein [Loigolactobacillus binensis]
MKMLVAQNAQQKYLNCLTYSRPQLRQLQQQAYTCPACQQPVMLKVGTTMQPHFAHFAGAACHAATEGETAEHLAGKALLGQLCRRWQVTFAYEVYLPAIQQRPDLLLSIGHRRIALEFQCSPITVPRLQARTQGYHQIGYQVIWILGQRYQRQQWRQSNHAFLQYALKWGWYQWHLVVARSELRLLHHIAHSGYPQQTSFQVSTLSQLQHITPPQRPPLSVAALLNESRQLYYKLGQAAPELQQLQQACYLKGHHLAGTPLCCHQASMPPLNRRAIVLLQVRLLLFCEQLGQVTLAQLRQFCWQNARAFYCLPLVDEQFWYLQWCVQTLKNWQRQGIVTAQETEWHYQGAQWYGDYFAKQRALLK